MNFISFPLISTLMAALHNKYNYITGWQIAYTCISKAGGLPMIKIKGDNLL